ncbi:MAG: tRNA lysidine(34) synthetase TilS [Bacteroidetes bacterium]|jgi:tRNA(Ile)-lysidine synthase|nr:tRNA lysidine(34) synthetase TilS [Bacteroidota bacterium]
MLEQVRAYIHDHHLLTDGQPVLVAVSGGLDSTVLLHILVRLGYAAQAAHVNYGLRGAESDADEAFVRAWCDELGVPIHVHQVEPQGLTITDTSVQAAARQVRYAFFAEVARAEQVPTVAVAHHRDDQVETMLLHLTRGAGPEGLAGMAPQRAMQADPTITVVRPLLGVWREDIAAYAADAELSWREDASNEGLDYQRNVIRHRILPMLEDALQTSVRAPMARTAELMRAYVDEIVRPLIAERFEVAAKPQRAGGLLQTDVLLQQPPTLRQRLVLEALSRWLPSAPRSAAVAEEVAGLVSAEVGRHVEFGAGTVWRTREGLFFRPAPPTPPDPTPTELHPGTSVDVPQGVLSLDLLDAAPADVRAGGDTVAFVDASALDLPLTVRPWRPGDRVQPLGMTGTKRVSDLLTDARVPPYERPHVLVVTSGDAIVWVVGLRLDERFKVTPASERVARLAVEPFASESKAG